MQTEYLHGVIRQFAYYRQLGERAMDQVNDAALHWQYNPESNSIAIIVHHLSGNMLSRFTDFLTTDGEKPWRDRDAEFEVRELTRDELRRVWNRGWDLLLDTLGQLTEEDLSSIVYIRNEGHTVMEAINRQLAHYPYHIGQIVYLARMQAGEWKSLSIPRKGSEAYNAEKFDRERGVRHFTDDLLASDDEPAPK